MFYFVCIIGVLMLISLRVLLTLWVNSEADNRECNTKKLWTIFTAVIGFLSAVAFEIIVPKKEKENRENKKSKWFILSYLAMLVAVVLFAVFAYAPASELHDNEMINSFSGWEHVYKNADGDKVIYDKMGNAYTYEQYDKEYKYYDRQGNSYVAILDEACGRKGFRCLETGEEFIDLFLSDDRNCQTYFDSEGYLCIFDTDYEEKHISIYMPDETYADAVYYDDKGNLYYSDSDFEYDDHGKLVFNKSYQLKDFKYSDIPAEEFVVFD